MNLDIPTIDEIKEVNESLFINSIMPKINKLIENVQTEDRFVSKKEAARILDCCESTIDNLRRRCVLKSYKVGNAVRFKRSELINSIEEV